MLLTLLSWGGNGVAADFMDGRLQVHGFLSQGVVLTSNNNFAGHSDDSASTDFREIGVNLSYRASPDLLVSGQVISERVGNIHDDDIRMDYGMLDWTVSDGTWGRAGIRLGRVKNPFGLYNDTRGVAFNRPGILLPQSIYFEYVRNLEMSTDGLDLYLESFTSSGIFSVNYVTGYGQVGDKSVEAGFLGNDFPGQFDSNVWHLLNLRYDGDGGRYRLGITSLWAGMKYDPKANSPIPEGTVDFHPIILSAQYNAEKWSLTGEYFIETTRFNNLGAIPEIDPTVESYYLQGTYMLAPKWEVLLRYDALYLDKDDRSGKKNAAVNGRPPFTNYAKDWTVGLRYDVTPHFMVRAEYHRVDGTAWLSSLENSDPQSLDRRWDMFMLLGSVSF